MKRNEIETLVSRAAHASLYGSNINPMPKHISRITNYVEHTSKKNPGMDIEEIANHMCFIYATGCLHGYSIGYEAGYDNGCTEGFERGVDAGLKVGR